MFFASTKERREKFAALYNDMLRINSRNLQKFVNITNSIDLDFFHVFNLIQFLITRNPKGLHFYCLYIKSLKSFSLVEIENQFQEYYDKVWFIRLLLNLYLEGALDNSFINHFLDNYKKDDKIILFSLFFREFYIDKTKIVIILDNLQCSSSQIKKMRMMLEFLNDESQRKSLILNGYTENTLNYAIMMDDIDSVIEIIDKIDQITISCGCFVVNPTNRDLPLINFAARCGSVKCFKYFLTINENSNTKIENIEEDCVVGGSLEILRLCLNHLNNDNLSAAILNYGTIEMLDWILDRIGNNLFANLLVSIIHYVSTRNIAAIQVILSHIDVDLEIMSNLFSYAVYAKDAFMLDFVLDRCDYYLTKFNISKPILEAVKSDNVDIVKLVLFSKNIDVNETDSIGETPLAKVSLSGNIEILKLLLTFENVDVNKKSVTGATPLHFAARKGHHDIITLLLQNTKINADPVDIHKTSPFLEAISYGNIDCVRDFGDRQDVNIMRFNQDAESALHIAARNGYIDIIQYLLEKGMPKEIWDGHKRTPKDVATEEAKHLFL